jgi:hypothetical protein
MRVTQMNQFYHVSDELMDAVCAKDKERLRKEICSWKYKVPFSGDRHRLDLLHACVLRGWIEGVQVAMKSTQKCMFDLPHNPVRDALSSGRETTAIQLIECCRHGANEHNVKGMANAVAAAVNMGFHNFVARICPESDVVLRFAVAIATANDFHAHSNVVKTLMECGGVFNDRMKQMYPIRDHDHYRRR